MTYEAGKTEESDEPMDGTATASPDWLVGTEDVGERSAVMIVRTDEGDVRYLIPRISLFDYRPSPESSQSDQEVSA